MLLLTVHLKRLLLHSKAHFRGLLAEPVHTFGSCSLHFATGLHSDKNMLQFYSTFWSSWWIMLI